VRGIAPQSGGRRPPRDGWFKPSYQRDPYEAATATRWPRCCATPWANDSMT
jgi:hypothetical protein